MINSFFEMNNELLEDLYNVITDSTTSSTSYLEEKHDDSTLNSSKLKKEIKNNLIQPVMPKPFKIPFTEIEIDDSFELSLLRFIHLVFSNDGVINFKNLLKFMDLNIEICNELNDFFIDNPGVMYDYEFYYSDTGVRIRYNWYNLLSNRHFLTYKNTDNTAIKPELNNILNFFRNFFPKLSFIRQDTQELLTNIYNQLNFNFDSFEVIYSVSHDIVPNIVHTIDTQIIKINHIDVFIWELINIKNDSNNVIFSDSILRYE